VARLAIGGPIELHAHAYVLGLLDWAGWGPDLDACSRCRCTLNAEVRPIVDPRGSGLACARHEAESAGYDAQDPAYKPSRRVVEQPLLDYVRALRAQAIGAASEDVTTAATALLHRLVDLHIQRPLRSREFLATLR
jgi:recombinational DNA repair protein (RecF pathway)